MSGYSYNAIIAPIPEPARNIILKLADQIPTAHLDTEGREAEPHITILYGIDKKTPATDITDIIKKLGTLKNIKLGKSKIFHISDNTAVVYLPVLNITAPVKRLHKHIEHVADVTHTHGNYVPHITLAYIKAEHADKYFNALEYKGPVFDINNVYYGTDSNRHDIMLDKDHSLHNPPGVATGFAVHIKQRRAQLARPCQHAPWYRDGQMFVPGHQLHYLRQHKKADTDYDLVPRGKSILHDVMGFGNTILGGRPIVKGAPGGPLWGLAMKTLVGAGLGAAYTSLRIPKNDPDKKRKRRNAMLMGAGLGIARGLPVAYYRVRNNLAGDPQAQGPLWGLLRSNSPAYFR